MIILLQKEYSFDFNLFLDHLKDLSEEDMRKFEALKKKYPDEYKRSIKIRDLNKNIKGKIKLPKFNFKKNEETITLNTRPKEDILKSKILHSEKLKLGKNNKM
jgi:hypothetical protein